MSKNISAKYYQEIKERLQKKLVKYVSECYKNLSEDEKNKLFVILKRLSNEKKCFIIIIKKCFDVENVASL